MGFASSDSRKALTESVRASHAEAREVSERLGKIVGAHGVAEVKQAFDAMRETMPSVLFGPKLLELTLAFERDSAPLDRLKALEAQVDWKKAGWDMDVLMPSEFIAACMGEWKEKRALEGGRRDVGHYL